MIGARPLNVTFFAPKSIPVIGALWIVALSWFLTRSRSECPTAVVSSRPVASWYSNGWKVW